MKKYKFKIRGSIYGVEILKAENNIVDIEVNGTKYKVELEEMLEEKKTPRLVRPAVPHPKTHEKKIKKVLSSIILVKAPLPGIITKILVREGDVIKKGDTLSIMEAMKMENNIDAEKGGTIKSIKVQEGGNVLQDDLLIELN